MSRIKPEWVVAGDIQVRILLLKCIRLFVLIHYILYLHCVNHFLYEYFTPYIANTIAFYAFLGQRERSSGLHHTVVSDRVITNVGTSYNHNDGAFRASVGWVYVFNWNLYSSYHWDIISELMVNSVNLGGRRSDSNTSGHTLHINNKETLSAMLNCTNPLSVDGCWHDNRD